MLINRTTLSAIPRLSSPLAATGFLSLPSGLRLFATTPAIQTNVQSPPNQEGQDKQSGSNQDPAMASKRPSPSAEKKTPAVPRPSASVLVISPTNQVLLLRRVSTSTSFASAHVFPGGNVSTQHDGTVPPPEDLSRHRDSNVYRLAAIRETFEESGLLLARRKDSPGRLLDLDEQSRDQGRVAIHSNKVAFPDWLAQHGGEADVQGLIPFTRWITPANVPRRFTTQMYLYFLPLSGSAAVAIEEGSEDVEAETRIPNPTDDGGKEHTAARFLPASVWCRLAQEGRLILFPPQFFLLHQVAQFFDQLSAPSAYSSISREAVSSGELTARRNRLVEFVRSGNPPWSELVISPTVLPPRDGKRREDGRTVLALDKSSPELQGTDRKGTKDFCVLTEFKKEGPRRVSVMSRSEALGGSEDANKL